MPLKSIATGPASLVMEGVPWLVRRGLRALESIFSSGSPANTSPAPDPSPWEHTPWDS